MSGNFRFSPHSDDPVLNPPGIPLRSQIDLDTFVDAAERANRRWMERLEALLQRISDSELRRDAEQRAYDIVQQINLLWTWLWVSRCFLPCVRVQNPQQLARWCDFQRRLLPLARTARRLDWRNVREAVRSGVEAVEAALAAPADKATEWCRTCQDLLDADNTSAPAADARLCEDAPARVVEAAWQQLRNVAGDRPYPPERTRVATEANARKALDKVMNWCLSLGKPPDQKPRWDGDNRTVHFRGSPIKTYRRGTAHRQIEILEAFEKEGWPSIIPEPFNNQSLLSQTLRDLNRALPADTILFRGDGSGGVRWDPVPPR
jgi:hypothetical protein